MGLKENQEKLKTRHDVIVILADKYNYPVPQIGDGIDTPLARGKVIWRERVNNIPTGSGWRIGVKLPESFVPTGTLD